MPEFAPGIYEDMPFRDYLAVEAFSKSAIHSLLRSPAHYQHFIKHGKRTSVMEFGSLVDIMVLEPEKLRQEIGILPSTYLSKGVEKPFNRKSTTCRDIERRLGDKYDIVVTEADVAKAKAMAANVRAHLSASEMLSQGKKQVSIFWVDETTKMPCKARIDNLRPDGIDDLKATKNAAPGPFSRIMANLGYHAGAAVYIEAWAATHQDEKLPFNFIVVEYEEPHGVATYELGPESLPAGQYLFRKALDVYAECQSAQEYPTYSEYIEPIEVPFWAQQVPEEGLLNE